MPSQPITLATFGTVEAIVFSFAINTEGATGGFFFFFKKKGVLKNYPKFTGKHLCQSLYSTLLKKRLWHRCFPVNFTEFLKTPILKNICERLILHEYIQNFPYFTALIFSSINT